ncbi:ABC transporter permease [Agrobacterium sp. SHOUNA12C]|nr:ABC transporter permease [Rhizobium rhizogenes]KAA6488953.1 ABC transporter permease [Agrobacterium sp. ICMP 7243]MCJ9721113.1 ABC transporter permease [Agrobacterium sp. BETTINA12B]MCJ9755870.1 ABC transporter permease [Agrobacterium sp. SHOUNA12C]OCJ01443.1 peptide ABC transporter permease [Agrobacterium sp. 13-626]OCJ16113.1 peptide ABC transporter permease [Agrobacterium sp. B131/95]OCJ19154.1 peptide ABC transporter permease [Agrobacterium sp. B133/95]
MAVMTSTSTPVPQKAVSRSVASRIIRRATATPGFKIGLIIFILLAVATATYPELSGIDPTKMDVKARLFGPLFIGDKWSWIHPLGTDQIGRDMLVRSLVGLRYSFLIGVSSVAVTLLIGCALGTIAGYFGGRTDTVIMRLTDAQLSIPMIILAIAVLGVSRPTIPAIILVLGVSSWPTYARIMRSIVMTERQREYVRAAKLSGSTDVRIILSLLAPLLLPPVLFTSVLDIARMMIFESVLGFLGLGVQPPTPTFGNIIADGRKYLLNAWWIATMPGIFLGLTLTSINLVGASLERARNNIHGGAE